MKKRKAGDRRGGFAGMTGTALVIDDARLRQLYEYWWAKKGDRSWGKTAMSHVSAGRSSEVTCPN
jgi:hypothetical protein